MKVVTHLTTVHSAQDTRIYQRFSKGISGDVDGIRIFHCGKSPAGNNENVDFIQVDKRRGRPGRMFLSSLKMFFYANRAPSDVYHIHDPEIFWLSYFLPKKSVVVIDFHENYAKKIHSKSWLPSYLKGFFLNLYIFVLNVFIPKRTKIIAAAESVLDGMPDKLKKRAVVIRNLPAWKMDDEFATDFGMSFKRGRSEGGLNILYTGGLTEYRGVENVIKAVVLYGENNWSLTIIGKKSEATFKKVKDYLSDSRIDFRGQVSYRESMKLNADSDIGMVCNLPIYDYDKALPNKLFEYLSFGTPVVCSKFPIWEEIIVSNNVGEVCDPTKPESIAIAIKQLGSRVLNDATISSRCVDLIQNKYSWENEKVKLLKVYDVL